MRPSMMSQRVERTVQAEADRGTADSGGPGGFDTHWNIALILDDLILSYLMDPCQLNFRNEFISKNQMVTG